jgi:hypothetical protein
MQNEENNTPRRQAAKPLSTAQKIALKAKKAREIFSEALEEGAGLGLDAPANAAQAAQRLAATRHSDLSIGTKAAVLTSARNLARARAAAGAPATTHHGELPVREP